MNIITTGVRGSNGRAYCIGCFSKLALGGITAQGNITNVTKPGLRCAHCGQLLCDVAGPGQRFEPKPQGNR